MEEKEIHILIADDNPDILKIMKIFLDREGYHTSMAIDGAGALALIKENNFQLIILDIMMPGLSGIETCQRIRQISNAPILFVTAKSKEQAQLAAYESGGDDYLTKPFSKDEFLVRVHSLLRRYTLYQQNPAKKTDTILISSAHLEIRGDRVYKGGELLDLTSKEWGILSYLIRHRGETISSKDLYENVWEEKYLPSSSNTIMVHMMKLRRKVEEDPNKPALIQTVWGRGYQLDYSD